MSEIGERLQALLDGSGILAASAGRRTQDALSLRAIPHVHGAAREVFAMTAAVVLLFTFDGLAAVDGPATPVSGRAACWPC